LGCLLDNKSGAERIRRIRQLDDDHNFTLVCQDLSELSRFARVDNSAYRRIKHATPGPYTFIFEASKEVPRRLMSPKRKTIGLRVPDNAITQALLAELGQPLMSATLLLPGDDYPLSDPYDIRVTLERDVDLVIDGGYCGLEPTTVIDMSGEDIRLLRQGLGSSDGLV
jgi:tRNA threonylcarbamoyl adenosine modification protein (Sua5/YciO/YrdC/YwlC family)